MSMIYPQLLCIISICLMAVYLFGFYNHKFDNPANNSWRRFREWSWWMYFGQVGIVLWILSIIFIAYIKG